MPVRCPPHKRRRAKGHVFVPYSYRGRTCYKQVGVRQARRYPRPARRRAPKSMVSYNPHGRYKAASYHPSRSYGMGMRRYGAETYRRRRRRRLSMKPAAVAARKYHRKLKRLGVSRLGPRRRRRRPRRY